MKIKANESRGKVSHVHFGPILQSDSDAKYQIFTLKHDPMNPDVAPQMKVVKQGPIPRKGRLKADLPRGKYMVMAQGHMKAGVVHTANEQISAPFYLSIDADESTVLAQERQRQMEEQRRKMQPSLLTRAVKYILR